MIELYHGDCLEVMKELPDESVDMILTDLPYGTTDARWDSVIPLDKLWEQYKRIIKYKGQIVLFSSQPFTTELIQSNLPNYKYTWYWLKNNVTNFANARHQPMRKVEEINVFRFDKMDNKGRYLNLREYFRGERDKTGMTSKNFKELLGNQMASRYFTNGEQFTIPTEENYKKLQSNGHFNRPYREVKAEYDAEPKDERTFTYNPQGLKRVDIQINKEGNKKDELWGGNLDNNYNQEYTNYPNNVLEFRSVSGPEYVGHPTQKPVELLEYLIKTYSNEGETVLDSTMGSGSTGVACKNTGRSFIGIEMNDEYFNIAKERIESHEHQLELV